MSQFKDIIHRGNGFSDNVLWKTAWLNNEDIAKHHSDLKSQAVKAYLFLELLCAELYLSTLVGKDMSQSVVG